MRAGFLAMVQIQEYPKVLFRQKTWDDYSDFVIIYDTEEEKTYVGSGYISLNERKMGDNAGATRRAARGNRT
jgi:hypothetical protein